jgi:hypothetical protein
MPFTGFGLGFPVTVYTDSLLRTARTAAMSVTFAGADACAATPVIYFELPKERGEQ